MSNATKQFSPGTGKAAAPQGRGWFEAWCRAVSEFVDWSSVGFNERHGLTSMALVMARCDELWANPGFEKKLDTDLRAAGLGHLDSALWDFPPHPMGFYLYLRTDALGAGIEFCRQRLDNLGLLRHAALGVLDPSSQTWRGVDAPGQ